MSRPRRLLFVSCAALCLANAASAAPVTVAPITVIGVTPLKGADEDRSAIAAPVQTATGDDIDRSHAPDLTAFLNRELGGVYVNDVQNNPLQPDINYRGYTASPLLGTPQGLSVYMDGVRLNQPFGDVVSWDLIPRMAISDITLAPGSNPLFGLNTLGGALSIRTKDGKANPGATVQAGYGSYGRWQIEAETGGHAANGLNWYLTGSHFHDDGWRDASPSNATQLFGKLGWSDADTDLALSGAFADTNLTGNGLQQQSLLEADRASIYTKPDVTKNRSGLLDFNVTHRFSAALSFSGAAYYRKLRTPTLNGDLNDDSLTESVYQPNAAEQAALKAAGYSGFPTGGESAANTPFPSWRCIANALLNTEPNEKCDGLLNRTRTDQHEAGVSGQFTLATDLAGRANQFTAGAAYSASRAHFTQSSQLAYLTPDRGVIGVNAFADGTQDSEDAFDARVDLTGRTQVFSAYSTDAFALTPALILTLSGRYDDSHVKNRDGLTPGGGPGSLEGDDHFRRFNPAVGLTWSHGRALTVYAGYNQGSRAPSAIELGCADPDNPCRLPNALAGDPPLKQVVTRNVELGARGSWSVINWRAGVFRADNHNDILFVADDTSGFGYFKNFGQTRRQGVELGLDGHVSTVSFDASYTYLDATYRSAEVVSGEGNSTNDAGPGFEGNIAISPGDRIPLVPRQVFKAGAEWAVTSTFSLSADMIAQSGVYARGNENNQHQPDGVFYLGKGKTDGFAVFNLGADYRPAKGVKLFAEITNLFDKDYSTAAQLGAVGFTPQGAFLNRPFAGPIVDGERPVLGTTFYGPGAPRMIWVGARYAFGG